MSLFKGFFDSLSDIFAAPPSQNIKSTMENSPVGIGTPVSNERTAYKLKGYFELAKEEIAKAVRAEEWGLAEDAVSHYKNAQRILIEAKDTRPPSCISPSEQEKVKSYYQKITKWQGQVSERLQVLSQRTLGTSSTSKTTIAQQPKSVKVSTARKDLVQKPSVSDRNNVTARNQMNVAGSPNKANQENTSAYDTKLVEMINTAIVDRSPSVKWDDVAGLEKAKQSLLEMVILPTKRKDLFTGLRRPARGLLLFGPPGNGKTMLAKAVASESEATFFNVSASSLTSKWVGEAEKLVRTLFMVAISRQPSVIFMDEIDSIMSTRLANENDASRRLKSEFLVQFDGVSSNPDDLVIVIGATNKPQELDDAVLRRLVKRIYVPLPDENVRRLLLKNKLKGQAFSLPGIKFGPKPLLLPSSSLPSSVDILFFCFHQDRSYQTLANHNAQAKQKDLKIICILVLTTGRDLESLVKETEGYSGSDLQALCEEAAMMPIRELGSNILTVNANQVRPLRYADFQIAMTVIRPSLQKSKWDELEKWNQEFGSS
ncbi:hypothetical protein IFM89_014026 [Coptis chinensis]|uniref:microtubule-severing ATPase n=1 Tax=Coptis chinensis TaxID=261450 RepID=A0A835M7X0_9MAGN|nr:hypothetical protein IFM89_014026 [Coptis chinensis]